MSNNTRRPPSGGTYSNGRGGRRVSVDDAVGAPSNRTASASEYQTAVAPIAPSNKPFEPQHMWILFGVWTGTALIMMLLGRPLHALAMWSLAVLMCPLTEKIILREARNISHTAIRIVTSRMVRFLIACFVGFFVGISFIISLGNSIGADDPDPVVLSNSPSSSIVAEATIAPTATPTSTPASVNDIVATLDASISSIQDTLTGVTVTSEYSDNFYAMYFTPEETATEEFMLLLDKDSVPGEKADAIQESFDEMTLELCVLSRSIKGKFDDNGHTDCHVVIHLVNPANTDNVLYTAMDGVRVYSFLDEVVPSLTPTPTKKPKEETKAEDKEEMVWIPTKGGDRYHRRESCSKMVDPEYVTKKEAKERGFTSCGICYK